MLPLSANLRTKGRFAILKLVYFACLGFFMTTFSSTSKRFHVPRYLGAFLWDDQDQDQCSKITWIMLYQNDESMDPCPQWIHRLIWCNITQVISDHWSWPISSQRNAPFAEFILEIGQWGSNGPPSVILGDPFSKKGGPRKELSQKVFYMGRTRRTLCRHFGTFLANEKAWARITAESRMFVCWNNDSNEEEKGNWDSKRL